MDRIFMCISGDRSYNNKHVEKISKAEPRLLSSVYFIVSRFIILIDDIIKYEFVSKSH